MPETPALFEPSEFFDLAQTEHIALFDKVQYPWDVLQQIGKYLQFRLKPGISGVVSGKPFISDQVYIGPGTVVEQGAYLKGPAWIGANCQVRNSAYIRENVIVGDGCTLGNSCEFKNCLLFNGAEVPHFSYVGDSILGHKAHLGAGVILSNLRLDRQEVTIQGAGMNLPTGLKKFGAMVGDGAEIGCNSVLNPGSLIGKEAVLYPGTIWRGHLQARHIARNEGASRLQVFPRR
jgi:NDP-sugar pyrophosphorylase family protein